VPLVGYINSWSEICMCVMLNNKLIYRGQTAQCVLSIEILSPAAQLQLLLLLLLHPFNGLFSKTAWVSRHLKGKPFRIFL